MKQSAAATEAFHAWRTVPAPIRGQLVREIGNELRANKEAVGLPGRRRLRQDLSRGSRRGPGDD